MKRTQFLIAGLMVISFLAACAAPTPQTVEVTREVTREKEVTAEVEEKEVTRQVETVVTATPEPVIDASSMEPVEGGTLRLVLDTSPGGYYNPGLAPSSYTSFVGNLIWPQLWRWNEDGSGIAGDLVESWEQNEDFTKMTLHIHPDAVWHDGVPITADDVAFTIWVISHPDIESNRGSVIEFIQGLEGAKHPAGADSVEGVEVIDDKTLELTFQMPMPEIAITEPMGIWMSIIPKHIMGDVPPEEFNDHEFWQNPTVGGGPFKFVEFREDEYVELERFDDFYLGRPYVERLIVKIADPATIVAQLEKGEVDMTTGITTVPLDDWERVVAMPDVVTDLNAIGTGIRLQFNCAEGEPLADKRVRQAIAYSLNRQLIVDRVLNGLGYVTNNFRLEPTNPYYNHEVDDLYPYNPERAQELLAEANWDFDTEIDLLVPTGETTRELAGDVALANLTQAGFNVNYRKLEYRTELSIVRNERDFDLAMIRNGVVFDPQSDYRAGNYSGEGYNYSYREFPELDALLDELSMTLEFEERQEIVHEIAVVMNDILQQVVLYYPYAPNAYNTRVHNLSYITGYLGLLRNAHEWWVEPE
jgi:peptide/nickel transport system substrate-binding protein